MPTVDDINEATSFNVVAYRRKFWRSRNPKSYVVPRGLVFSADEACMYQLKNHDVFGRMHAWASMSGKHNYILHHTTCVHVRDVPTLDPCRRLGPRV